MIPWAILPWANSPKLRKKTQEEMIGYFPKAKKVFYLLVRGIRA
jgi:hypothetical protein